MPTAEATDWPQILALYERLMRISESPVVALNHRTTNLAQQRYLHTRAVRAARLTGDR